MDSQQKQHDGYRGSSEANNKMDNWHSIELQRDTTEERSTPTIEKNNSIRSQFKILANFSRE